MLPACLQEPDVLDHCSSGSTCSPADGCLYMNTCGVAQTKDLATEVYCSYLSNHQSLCQAAKECSFVPANISESSSYDMEPCRQVAMMYAANDTAARVNASQVCANIWIPRDACVGALSAANASTADFASRISLVWSTCLTAIGMDGSKAVTGAARRLTNHGNRRLLQQWLAAEPAPSQPGRCLSKAQASCESSCQYPQCNRVGACSSITPSSCDYASGLSQSSRFSCRAAATCSAIQALTSPTPESVCTGESHRLGAWACCCHVTPPVAFMLPCQRARSVQVLLVTVPL